MIFRTTTAILAALLATAGMARAGGVAEPQAAPIIMPSPAPASVEAFEGPYVGLTFGQLDPGGTEVLNLGQSIPVPLDADTDTVAGLFAGYNFQSGGLVYGPEIMVWSVDAPLDDGATLTRLMDLRGRIGWATGNFLVYGAAGWSWGERDSTGDAIDVDGFNLGLGMEYNVTDRFMLGLDYTTRNLEGADALFSIDAEIDTIALRAGFRF